MSFSKRQSTRRSKLLSMRAKTPEECKELADLNRAMDLELMRRISRMSKKRKK